MRYVVAVLFLLAFVTFSHALYVHGGEPIYVTINKTTVVKQTQRHTLKRRCFKKEKKSVKSYIVHYENKYPGGRVDSDGENYLVAYDAQGRKRVQLQKDGAGMIRCVSAERGAMDCHDLAPIKKDHRFRKLYKDGKISDAEEAGERRPLAESMAKQYDGRVPSEFELSQPKADGEPQQQGKKKGLFS